MIYTYIPIYSCFTIFAGSLLMATVGCQVTILGKIMWYPHSEWHGYIIHIKMYFVKIINPPNALFFVRTNIDEISIICFVIYWYTVSVYIHQSLKYPKIANVYGSNNRWRVPRSWLDPQQMAHCWGHHVRTLRCNDGPQLGSSETRLSWTGHDLPSQHGEYELEYRDLGTIIVIINNIVYYWITIVL